MRHDFNVTKIQIKNRPKKLFLAILGRFAVLENLGKTSERFWKNLGKIRENSGNIGKYLVQNWFEILVNLLAYFAICGFLPAVAVL